MALRSMAVALAGLAGLSAAMLATPTVEAQPADSVHVDCFTPREFSSWKATPDARSIYLRVGGSKVYRLDLADQCSALRDPDVHLNLRLHGAGTFCTALDFDIDVSEGNGVSTPCLASRLSQLSPNEASALPTDLRP